MAEEVDATSARKHGKKLYDTLVHDIEHRLRIVDEYLHGVQRGPYMPDTADDEYKLLAERCINNIMPLLVRTPVQGCYVDGYRPGKVDTTKTAGEIATSPAWDWWQYVGLDAKQSPIYTAAVGYGHSFFLVEKDAKDRLSGRGLSPMSTSAIYDDPAWDIDPVAVLHVVRWPEVGDDGRPGKARLWDGEDEWDLSWKNKGFDEATYTHVGKHGASTPPVTRFAPELDLDGRTTGLVWEMIPPQDRLNQTIFDLLVAQTGSSFNTRVFTGMAPPMKMKAKYEQVPDGNGGFTNGDFIGFEPEIGPDGQPIPLRFQMNGRQAVFLNGEGEKPVGVHNLEGTQLQGYIDALTEVKESISSATQTPPTYLLGQIANLSAEALNAAEISLTRKIQSYQKSFGESWERVFRIVGEMSGDVEASEDYNGEVIWRDSGSAALSQTADALGKLNENVGVPKRGLWARIPGVTQGELAQWEQWREEEDAETRQAEALERAIGPRPSTTRSQPSAGSEAA
jgi:hypothetical protein